MKKQTQKKSSWKYKIVGIHPGTSYLFVKHLSLIFKVVIP